MKISDVEVRRRFLSERGRKGGTATKLKYGAKHWKRIGKLGGRPLSDRQCSKCARRIAPGNLSGICRKCQRAPR